MVSFYETLFAGRYERVKTEKRLSDRIRKAREAAGLTQAQLGALIGCTNSKISQYETQYCRPPHIRLVLLARVLSVSVDWLLTGRNAK